MNNLSLADGGVVGVRESVLDIKYLFQTREGSYRNLPAFEYSRPNRSQPNNGQNSQQANLPVKISIVHLPDDDSGYPDRILFNVGRELFFYAFKSIWQTPDLNRPLDRQVHKVQISAHDVNILNLSQQGCSLLIGFINGSFEIYDPRRETHLLNEDRLLDKGRVTVIKWLPGSTQQFLVGFSSGQLFQCDDSLPWMATPPTYQMHKHGEGYAVYTCKSRTPRNPLYRWIIGQGSLNGLSYSPCSRYIATVSHDGFLRVFLAESMDLLGSAKSYFGGLLCLCWSPDSKFVCCAGEDDLVHLFCLESRKIVARGRGHRSWVTAVAFDSMTSCWNTEQSPVLLNGSSATPLTTMTTTVSSPLHRDLPALLSSASQQQQQQQRITTYRFASVGQDTQICLWELTDDIVKQASYSRLRAGSLMPAVITSPLNSTPAVAVAPVIAIKGGGNNLKRSMGLIGGRNTSGSGGDKNKTPPVDPAAMNGVRGALGSPVCPKLEDVPMLEPLVCKRIAPERLNDIVFHEDCILISTQEGVIMTWCRPGKVPVTQSSRHNSCSN